MRLLKSNPTKESVTLKVDEQVRKILTVNFVFQCLLDSHDIRNAVNNAMLKRIAEKKHETRNHWRILQGDLEKVTMLRNFKKAKDPTISLVEASTLWQSTLKFGNHWICDELFKYRRYAFYLVHHPPWMHQDCFNRQFNYSSP